MPPNPRGPLINYLGVQRRVDAELNRMLARAARDAQRRVAALELGPQGIGARVRQAQLHGVLRSIREQQDKLWREGVGPLITSKLQDAQFAAIAAAETIDDVLFASLPEDQAEVLRASVRETAHAGLRAEAHRQSLELSPRVWKNASLASRAIERTIQSGIIQGLSARELASTVAGFIRPDTPGGVSYAAKRLARTEINNAFHNQQIASGNKPWVLGTKWNLSNSHPKPDDCDKFAKEDAHELGQGVFPKDDVPRKPHPHCLCFLTYELQDEDDFIAGLAASMRGSGANPASAPTTRARSLRDRYDGGKGVESRQGLGGGVTAEKIELLTMKDGSRMVYKQARLPQEAAAEVAYSAVGKQLGAKIPKVERLDENSVLMEYVEDHRVAADYGMTETDDNISQAIRDRLDEVYRSESGRRLGLLDTILYHQDRHRMNWMLDETGDVVGIDNGMHYIELNGVPTSPFAAALKLYRGPDYGQVKEWLPNQYTAADWDVVRNAVRAAEAELREIPPGSITKYADRPKGEPVPDGFEIVMQRIDKMAEQARGAVNQL